MDGWDGMGWMGWDGWEAARSLNVAKSEAARSSQQESEAARRNIDFTVCF